MFLESKTICSNALFRQTNSSNLKDIQFTVTYNSEKQQHILVIFAQEVTELISYQNSCHFIAFH